MVVDGSLAAGGGVDTRHAVVRGALARGRVAAAVRVEGVGVRVERETGFGGVSGVENAVGEGDVVGIGAR